MKHALLFILPLFTHAGFTQTAVYLRNNTGNHFLITVNQSGSFVMNSSDWSQLMNNFDKWAVDDADIFETNRTSSVIPQGDTALFDIYLTANADTVTLKLMLIGTAGGSALYYSASAPGFSDAWQSDSNFHQFQTTLEGKNVIIKYKPDNEDGAFNRDIRFVLHDFPIYEIALSDFENPNALNVMAYNIQMIPLGISGLKYAELRGDLLPVQISPYQDVVIFEEVFDDTARENHLAPAMLAAGFPYRTTILNASSGALPWNGGVIIFSRWHIEFSDEWDYTLCGQSAADCLSNKGVKYARINKLGKKYHIFGTHMDAGSQQDDINARLSNMREVRDFIAAQNIPQDEPVVYGGDFNISPISSDGLYFNMLDTLHPVIPNQIGYENSTFSGGQGKIIDHVWGDGKHLIPLVATNEIITMRSIEDTMWLLSEFSDHRTALGRFVYPAFEKKGVDTVFCPGDDLALTVNSGEPVIYQWEKDGSALSGDTASELSIPNAQLPDAGNYRCNVNYSVIFGDTSNSLNQYFFPSGPDTIEANIALDFGYVSLDCNAGMNDRAATQLFTLYPNPNHGKFQLKVNALEENTNFTLFSLIGEVVYSSKPEAQLSEIHLPKLSPGLYFAVLKNSVGQHAEKILIE